MNYFFLHNLTIGAITQTYLGGAEEWTNIPDGCGVIGPLAEDDVTAADAFHNQDCYTIVNGVLTPLPNITDIKAKKESDRQAQSNLPTLEDRIKSLELMKIQSMGL